MLEERRPQGIEKYIGNDLRSADSEKIGTIAEFRNNRLTEVPEWIVVSAGLLGGRTFIVPLAGADFDENAIVVPYTKQVIMDEPEIEDARDLNLEAESILGNYFGLGAA